MTGSRWVKLGAVAACADALIGAAATYVAEFTDVGSRPVGPIKVGDALALAVVLPEALVLAGLFFVARDVAGSLALWRGSVGFFGCFWVLLLLGVAEGPGWWQLVTGLTALVGVVLVVAAVFAKPWVMAEPVTEATGAPVASGEAPAGQGGAAPPVLQYAAERKASDWSWLWVGIGLFIGQRVLRKLGVTFEEGVALGALLLLVAACGFLVWLGVTKLGLARRLGAWGTASGCADLGLAAGSVGMMAWVLWMIIDSEMSGAGEVPDDDVRLRAAVVTWEAGLFVWKLVLAGLLWSVWRGSSHREVRAHVARGGGDGG